MNEPTCEHLWVAPVRHITIAVGRYESNGGRGPVAAWARPTNRMPLLNPNEHDPKKQIHESNEPSGDAVFCAHCKVFYVQAERLRLAREHRPMYAPLDARGEA